MTDAGDQALVVEGVNKFYGRRKALDGVGLAVAPGEFVVLLGPNGAGKTTLFQLLSGLFVADQGRIAVAGFDMARHPVGALATIGIVFQQPTLDLDLSVQANLAFHARLHGLPWSVAKPRIDSLLQRYGLTERRRDRARALSGGNRRRVELVRALLTQPKVLLMDEATVGLDPASRRQLLDAVVGLCHREGVAVLWATHLVDEAAAAHRVVVLHRGRVLRVAPPDHLVAEVGAPDLAAAFLQLTGSPAPPGGEPGSLATTTTPQEESR